MKTKIILLFLILVGFFYRIYGLTNKYSFWSDESHVAIFARAISETGKPILRNGYHTGAYQWFLYWISAISVKVFGLNEFAARFPSIVFGVLSILVVYLLGKELFNKKVGLLAAFLTTFLKIEILWSRQARPYQVLQFFYLLGAYFIYKLGNNKELEIKNLLGFLISGALAFLTHGLGLVVLFNGLLFLLITSFTKFKKWFLAGLPVFLGGLFLLHQLVLKSFAQIGKANNLFYYRVFFTHNYLLLTILAGIGGLFLLTKKEHRKFLLFVIFLGMQSFIVSFLLGQAFIRYFYIVFPFIILLAIYGLISLARIPKQNFLKKGLLFLLSMTLILGTKEKFAFWPQKTYSLNEDMQEVPEVDWKKIYQIVRKRLKVNPKAVLITNWNDLPVWYLGEGELDYLIRKDNRRVDPLSGAKFTNSLDKLKKLIKNEKSGLIVLDSWDDRVPDGVREYCHQNLKRELEVDRLYPIQPRYWTVWVYSWGLD